MTVSLIRRYHDGTCRAVDGRYADLREVIQVALVLADRHGRHSGYGGALTKCFEIWEDEEMTLSITVIPGGLRRGAAGPG